jgi:hypothetical protein
VLGAFIINLDTRIVDVALSKLPPRKNPGETQINDRSNLEKRIGRA